MRRVLLLNCLVLLFLFVTAQDAPKQNNNMPADTSKPKKPAGITDKVKSSKKIDGLFTMYQDTTTGSLQLYVKKNQLGKEFIYQSFSINGPTALFLNQSMHRPIASPHGIQIRAILLQQSQPLLPCHSPGGANRTRSERRSG